MSRLMHISQKLLEGGAPAPFLFRRQQAAPPPVRRQGLDALDRARLRGPCAFAEQFRGPLARE